MTDKGIPHTFSVYRKENLNLSLTHSLTLQQYHGIILIECGSQKLILCKIKICSIPSGAQVSQDPIGRASLAGSHRARKSRRIPSGAQVSQDPIGRASLAGSHRARKSRRTFQNIVKINAVSVQFTRFVKTFVAFKKSLVNSFLLLNT